MPSRNFQFSIPPNLECANLTRLSGGSTIKYMALTKQDLEQIKVDQRFDRLESLINDDYKQRIEKLENHVKELRDALAMK